MESNLIVNFAQPITQMQRPGVVMLVEQYRQAGVCVPKGYLYDGASIPRLLWSAIGLSPFSEIIGAATIHDYLYVNGGWFTDYQGNVRYATKDQADEIFRQLCIAAGIPEWKANTAHWAVSHFGKGAY